VVNPIESVQRRFTKKLRGMSLLTYDERCACLGLDRLQLRRLQCDLITCFKIINGFNCRRSEEFFIPCCEQITRGHPFKLRVQHCRIDARKYFFSSRVITIWNQLPAEVLNAVTVTAFVAKVRSCDLCLVICYRLNSNVYCRLGIDLSVRVRVYTFACTYF